MYRCELDHKEGRAPKNWCFQTVVLEKILESPLGSKEIKPVNLKGNQPWILTGRTDAKAETPILWHPDENSWLIGKKPWCWERLKAGEQQRMRLLDGITDSTYMNLGNLWETMKDREAWHALVHEVAKNWTWVGNEQQQITKILNKKKETSGVSMSREKAMGGSSK